MSEMGNEQPPPEPGDETLGYDHLASWEFLLPDDEYLPLLEVQTRLEEPRSWHGVETPGGADVVVAGDPVAEPGEEKDWSAPEDDITRRVKLEAAKDDPAAAQVQVAGGGETT